LPGPILGSAADPPFDDLGIGSAAGRCVMRRPVRDGREVLLLGERFFRDRPGELARRLRGHWKSWPGQASSTQANESL
jgi:hypothetical protein